MGQKLQQFVGARTADDALGREAVARRDGSPQRRGAAVRVALEMGGGGAIGFDRLRLAPSGDSFDESLWIFVPLAELLPGT